MSKHSKGFTQKDVKSSTTGSNHYGQYAHNKSTEAFHKETGRKATMNDAQTLRDMAEQRQDHFVSNINVDTDFNDF